MPSQVDNVIIQVRSKLQEKGIKLWLEPYYFEEIGPIESELENLASEFSYELGISYDHCKAAISELQDGALNKLRTRKEFLETGIATFNVRIVQEKGTARVMTVKCSLTDCGKHLQEKIANLIKTTNNHIRIICCGKVVQPDKSLQEQGISNNQQLMALVSSSMSQQNNDNEDIYDRVRKAKEDAELILQSRQHAFFRMEDQDGNAVHLPPSEQKAITLALALYEKGRSALKKDKYDEALVMFLEADEQFSKCDSNLLDSVDNYALLNLDIVWCYLCLKSVTQLPDAQRRLNICEQSFRKSYGENMNRLIALKGSSESERALFMRLHLLQGVVLFHQNRRNEAYEKLSMAAEELRCLKVDEESLLKLIDMGYNIAESRVALRDCNGRIDEAVNFILERRSKKQEARKRAKEENSINKKILKNDDTDWVNPKSVCNLMKMGFPRELVIAALKKSDNELSLALDFLHSNPEVLRSELSEQPDVAMDLVDELVKVGFDPEMAKIALESASNNSEQAVDLLLKMQKEGNYEKLLTNLTETVNENISPDEPGPSSGVRNKVLNDVKTKIKTEMEAMKAYERFAEDVSVEDDEYLDLPLVQEEKILLEYKSLLEQ